jgi:hypothetical protein
MPFRTRRTGGSIRAKRYSTLGRSFGQPGQKRDKGLQQLSTRFTDQLPAQDLDA